jgi:hypothetical protein
MRPTQLARATRRAIALGDAESVTVLGPKESSRILGGEDLPPGCEFEKAYTAAVAYAKLMMISVEIGLRMAWHI